MLELMPDNDRPLNSRNSFCRRIFEIQLQRLFYIF